MSKLRQIGTNSCVLRVETGEAALRICSWSAPWKEDGQLSRERKKYLEATSPQEAWRVEVLIFMRVVADGAQVIGDESRPGRRDRLNARPQNWTSQVRPIYGELTRLTEEIERAFLTGPIRRQIRSSLHAEVGLAKLSP